jgi:putative glutathione S-transferase
MTQKPAEDQVGYKHASKDGTFKRQISSFRSWISSEPGAEFPPEKDRYVNAHIFKKIQHPTESE